MTSISRFCPGNASAFGPNGAGKTTTIEICEGLTAPDGRGAGAGRAVGRGVAGHSANVSAYRCRKPNSAKSSPSPKHWSSSGAFTAGRGRSKRCSQRCSSAKSATAGSVSSPAVRSSGWRLACALVADPELFLDEPTTGLDPQSRRQLWDLIEEVKRAGRTVVITTHYMEEAERLCDRVAIVDHGKVIALGTPRHPIASLGAQHIIEFSVGEDQPSLADADLLQLPAPLSLRRQEDSYLLESAEAHRTIPALLMLLGVRFQLARLRTHSATLEDVFVHLTGRTSAMAEVARRRAERPLVRLTHVRILEFIREPEAIFWTFLFPDCYGRPRHRTWSRLESPSKLPCSPRAGGRRNRQAARGKSLWEAVLLDDSAAAKALRTGRTPLSSSPGARATWNTASTTPDPMGAAARRVVDDVLQRGGDADPISVSETRSVERGSRYIDFVVPGLLGMNSLGSGIWGIGFSVVDARRKRLLKRLVATPMPKAAYLASFIISGWRCWCWRRAFRHLGMLAFGVPMWDPGPSAPLSSPDRFAFGGLGLQVAHVPRTIEGASGLMNLAMVPMWVFSGVFFSSSRPEVIQPLCRRCR